jgi:hypothetical protein
LAGEVLQDFVDDGAGLLGHPVGVEAHASVKTFGTATWLRLSIIIGVFAIALFILWGFTCSLASRANCSAATLGRTTSSLS